MWRMLKLRGNKEKLFIRTSRSTFNAYVIHPSFHTLLAAIFRKLRQNKANLPGTGTLQSGNIW